MKKALIVDDLSYIRFEIQDILEKLGYQTFHAENGLEAIEMYKEISPNIVTMDINMPKMDGLRATKRIISLDSNACIIICSSMANFKHFRDIGAKAGAKVFISKPFTEKEIMEAILSLEK